MLSSPRPFKLMLLGMSLLWLGTFAKLWLDEIAGGETQLFVAGTPLGGDFINMWAAARLVLGGDVPAIYQPDAFMAFQQTFYPAAIGLRLWAYPPHSLFLALPFGIPDYVPALVGWSIAGLAVLALGARRMGLDWLETAIVLTSPATTMCLYFGQTGNLAAGLLLLALSSRGNRDALSIGAAALLTIKPQAGFLLPLYFAVRRQWWLIASIGAIAALLAGASALVFGLDAWRDYLTVTLPVLGRLESAGSGPFMLMIPSVFMALRVIHFDGSTAGTVHLVFAALVGAFVVWRLVRVKDQTARWALVLCGTVLITPYVHNYDLAILLCGALLVARLHAGAWPVLGLAVCAWALPVGVFILNGFGMPVSPLLMLPLLVAAGFPGTGGAGASPRLTGM